jgi:hypothetical protein
VLKLFSKGLHYWLPFYILQMLKGKEMPVAGDPIHIILCFVDHFEPFNGGANAQRAVDRVRNWTEGYPSMADKHHDSDGKMPQHTWFYPPHQDHAFLGDLVGLCKSGYGEIEMHLHHNHMRPFPDTSETLREKIVRCIEDYSEYGIFCLPDGRRVFGFIHGDWSLDNSLGDGICGVNDEMRILKECGCYADFTLPSLGKAQPMIINKIYYAKDNLAKPKSYNWGREVCVGGSPWGDLMLIQGITGIRWKSRSHRVKPSIEVSNIDSMDAPLPARIDYWVSNAVRIKGRPDWLFIKLHTHGCREVDFPHLFGASAHGMFRYLEELVCKNQNLFLHYVTAREMYNIAKAAESGLSGDPNAFRNYSIPPYLYITR